MQAVYVIVRTVFLLLLQVVLAVLRLASLAAHGAARAARALTAPDIAEHSKPRLLVIGGGFAGAEIAKACGETFQVTLCDTKAYFEFTPSVLR